MPIAITMDNDFAVHEDAEGWTTFQVGDDGPWMAQMVDAEQNPIGVDVVLQNVVQISHMTDAEFEEVAELL
jgi:ABC-type transport system substrate-binding protein